MEPWTVSLIFLLVGSAATLILGALAWSRTSAFHLPFPIWIPAVATLLSPATVLTIITTSLFIFKGSYRPADNRRNTLLSLIDQLYSILSTIIATLALAYLFPENTAACRLEQQWQSFFQSKNEQVIRSIQDNLQCCGLRSTRDRAWPFKNRDHGDDACELRFGYRRSCLVPWRDQQRDVSWMVFAAAVLMFALRIGFLQFSRRRPSWMSTFASRDAPGYQRITDTEADEGERGDAGATDAAEPGRAIFPAESGYTNEWGHS